jgi:hypothetical protein
LREEGHLFLQDQPAKIKAFQEKEIVLYLENEYHRESQDYPFFAPEFDAAAALWASKIVYHAALLILYRQDSKYDIQNLLPYFTESLRPSQILSADLLLRYLPFLYHTLENIDPEDPVLKRLSVILNKWHYSAIDSHFEPNELNLDSYFTNSCLQQLFFNRIVEQKNQAWGSHPAINKKLIDHLGFYKEQLWDSLNAITITTDESE